MADSFGDRVVAAVGGPGRCAPASTLRRVAGRVGAARQRQGSPLLLRACVEGFAGAVSVVKPQVAFFERHGSAGMAVLEQLIADATDAGLIVIADAKRGDIDSTAAAYADAWLGGPVRCRPMRSPSTPTSAWGPCRPSSAWPPPAARGSSWWPGLQPRGPGAPAGGHRPRAGGRGHAAGRDRRVERLAPGAGRDGGRRHRRNAGALRATRYPARRGIWRPGSAPRVPGRPMWRPASPGAGRAWCSRAAPGGSSTRARIPPSCAGECTLAEPRAGGRNGLRRENGGERPWPRRYGLAMPQPPALTPEQRGSRIRKGCQGSP